MSCYDQGPFEGGTYSQIAVSDSELTNVKSTNLVSENTTLNGSVKLDQTAAGDLVAAMQEVTPQVAATGAPVTDGEELPTTVVGSGRDAVLGRPDQWIKIGEYVIPAFKVKGNG